MKRENEFASCVVSSLPIETSAMAPSLDTFFPPSAKPFVEKSNLNRTSATHVHKVISYACLTHSLFFLFLRRLFKLYVLQTVSAGCECVSVTRSHSLKLPFEIIMKTEYKSFCKPFRETPFDEDTTGMSSTARRSVDAETPLLVVLAPASPKPLPATHHSHTTNL